MTFARKIWMGVIIFSILYFSLLYWCLYVFPGTQAQTVHSYRDVDVSQLEGKQRSPGRLAPETVQKQAPETSTEELRKIFRGGRNPFE